MTTRVRQAAWRLNAVLPAASKHYQKKMKKTRERIDLNDARWQYRCSPVLSMSAVERSVETFLKGEYKFSPMRQFTVGDEVIRVWDDEDSIIQRCFLDIVKPFFLATLPKTCYHLKGPNGVKGALHDVEQALSTQKFAYVIRLDIGDFYASIQHPILLTQLEKLFHDPKAINYLRAIVEHAVDKDGHVFLPEQGIPRGSSFSPYFGAVYLSVLDRAFENQENCSYFRYNDDILILVRNQRAYRE